jgi:hypothetical protein
MEFGSYGVRECVGGGFKNKSIINS